MALEERDLRHLTEELGAEWETLATHLGFSSAQIERFRIDGRDRGIDNAMFDMLVTWQHRQPQVVNFRKILGDALVKAGRRDLADSINPQRSRTDHSESEHNVFGLKQCQEQLRLHYLRSLCKIPLFPGDYETCVDLKDIYTKISISINLPNPCRPVKIPLTSLDELFTRKTDEGLYHSKLLLSAPAGLGKTTITAKMAYDWATKTEESPLKDIYLLFVVNMRWVDHASNLEDAILSQILPEDTNIKAAQLLNIIRQFGEKVVIILDAIDESDRKLYDHPESSGNIVKLLMGKILVTSRLRGRLIVTTRPWRTAEIARNCNTFTWFELNGFTKEDVKIYIQNFFKQDEGSRESLLQYVDQNQLLVSVASVPLMALLICLYWREEKGAEIPKRISHLYDVIMNIMRRHFLSKQKTQPVTPETRQPEHQMSRLRARFGKFLKVFKTDRSSKSPTATLDSGDILEKLGQMSLKGLWPPENRLVFSLHEAPDIEVVEEACQIGYISMQEPRLGSHNQVTSEIPEIRGASVIALPRKTPKLTFFHKSAQEKCAGEYFASLADNNKKELGSYLQTLKTVQEALSIQLVLRFASGANPKAAQNILERLMEIFGSESKSMIDSYYTEELALDDTLMIQQFLELCLGCNYEADCKEEFNHILTDLFPNGKVHFLGISAFTAIALGYYISHSQSDSHIKSITLRPIAHAGDNITPVGPLATFFYKSRKVVGQIPHNQMQDICKEYFKKHHGSVHEDNQILASQSPAAIVACIQMWQACQGLPTAGESNIGPIISSLEHLQLEVLDITGYKMGDKIDQLLEITEKGHLSHLLELRVSNIGMDEHQIRRLAVALRKIPLLTVIDTSYNKVGQSMEIMAESLPSVKSLQQLQINHMWATAQGMSMFAKKFQEFGSQLVELYISGNDINDAFASQFAEHLPIARLLRVLWISVNDLSKIHHNRLVFSIRHLSRLRRLDIYHCQYPDDLMVSVADVMESLPDLYYLSLNTYSDTPPQVSSITWKHFKAKLQNTTNLKLLQLVNSALEKDDFLDLVTLCRDKEYSRLRFSVVCLPEEVVTPQDDFFELV